MWYFRTVPTMWYFRAVPTMWYFRTVPTMWYFRTVPTMWYSFQSYSLKYAIFKIIFTEKLLYIYIQHLFHWLYLLRNKLT